MASGRTSSGSGNVGQHGSAVPGPSGSAGRGPRVDWLARIDGGEGQRAPLLETAGRVGLSACPGRPDLGGDVRSDLVRLQALGIKVMVTLVADREMEYYGVFGLRQAARAAGLRSLFLPCVDTQPPEDLPAAYSLCGEILGQLGEGHDVLIHCIGGWGRSGTLAACLLLHEGYAPEAAISLVRAARSPRCVESRAQERFVRDYAAARTEVRRYFTVVPRSRLRELLAGEAGSRRLHKGGLAPDRLVSTDELPQLLSRAQAEVQAQGGADGPGAALESLVVLTGELAPEELELVREPPLCRAFVCAEGRWRPAPFTELLPSGAAPAAR